MAFESSASSIKELTHMHFHPSTTYRYTDLVAHLSSLPRRHTTLLIGIDGCGGSGKSTFARVLHAHLPDSTVIHMDDLYLPSTQRPAPTPDPTSIAPSYDIPRLRDHILLPLTQDRDASYQRYDWPTDQLAESHHVPHGGIVIIEGVASLSHRIATFYDFTVWVESPYDIRLARGIARDGEAMRSFWADVWMPAEQVYIRAERPDQRAILRVDGSAQTRHDLEREFVTL
jgi:uridine kinase